MGRRAGRRRHPALAAPAPRRLGRDRPPRRCPLRPGESRRLRPGELQRGHEPPRRDYVVAPHDDRRCLRGAPADRVLCDHRTARSAQRVVRARQRGRDAHDGGRMVARDHRADAARRRAPPGRQRRRHRGADDRGVLAPRARRRAVAAPAGRRRQQRRYRRCPRRRSRLRLGIHGHVRRHRHPRCAAHHRRPRRSGREEVMGRDRGKPN